MSYKHPSARVVFEFGRNAIQVQVGGEWVVVAIRERKDCADALLRALLGVLEAHQDDDYAARARSEVDTVSLGGDDLRLPETPRPS